MININKNFFYHKDSDYVDRRRVDTPRGFPGTSPIVPPPNMVTQDIFRAKVENQGNEDKLAVIFMTTGQFLDHDIAFGTHGKCDVTE